MRLPGTSIALQKENLSSYMVKKNFQALLGNPWQFSFDVPTIEDIDLTTYNFAIIVHDANDEVLAQSRLEYISPLDFAIDSRTTERIDPGIYDYEVIAFSGTLKNTINYTLFSGKIEVLFNRTIDGADPIIKRISL